MTRPRKGSISHAAQTVAALHRGGLGALRAAEELVRAAPSTGHLQVRISQTRKAAYAAAAREAGVTLSAWVLAQLDAAVGR